MATTTDQTQTTQQRLRNVTGYIHYNTNDDLTKIFQVLKQFRVEHSLKFSHHRDYIFFSLKSECLNDLAKQQPFRISHYRSKSEYRCDKATADKLTKQVDSFLRMTYMEDAGLVLFQSRTLGRIHNQLVRRIFKDTEVEFNRENYTIVRHHLNNDSQRQDEEETQEQEFTTVSYKKREKTSTPQVRGKNVSRAPVVDNTASASAITTASATTASATTASATTRTTRTTKNAKVEVETTKTAKPATRGKRVDKSA